MKKKSCRCGPSCTCKTCSCGPYASFFETLGNENRLHIISALRGGPKNVSEIIEETGLEQTCVSHCLRKLEHGGFVTAKRDGKYRIYTLQRRTIEPLMTLIDDYIKTHWRRLMHGKTCACGRTA